MSTGTYKIHIHTHITCTSVCTHTYSLTHVHTHTYIHTYIHTCAHAHTHTHTVLVGLLTFQRGRSMFGWLKENGGTVRIFSSLHISGG